MGDIEDRLPPSFIPWIWRKEIFDELDALGRYSPLGELWISMVFHHQLEDVFFWGDFVRIVLNMENIINEHDIIW